ncbi:nitrate reductase [Methylobrevis albus]|uniref:Molybdopterin-dependent oxidoreductase n=1 Tax=Methylobrevis albus TaxID=2793297 RepID=A0A931I5K3_9HYPH|nr:nitrate reductase [Methylobrevis albus]MBH0239688.1 molybdopterin-dependent oxidoreductase [Methylobrevis albus]
MKRDPDAFPLASDPLPASTTVRTTCPYCGVGCGVLATTSADGVVSVAGDPEHPANFGRLCSKGAALAETLSLDDRLLHPEIGGARASWDDALGLVAGRFAETIAAHGPDSVAFYVSGQFLTEDYYAANKLMKGFIGSGNIDTNSRLCMASSVAGHKRAFGSDTVPGCYEDLEEADLVVLVGSNLAWCHPVLFQRLSAAKAARPELRIVNIDPRRTATSELADLQLAIAPGGDVALFSALLCHLADVGAADIRFIARHTNGLAETIDAAAISPDELPAATGLALAEIETFFDWFAGTAKVVTVYSQGVNQSVTGTDKVNAIINCHLLTGRIGRPGMGPFSVTGQPNAMGGREVGGLANQLAAHMDIGDAAARERVQRFWQAPTIADRPGLKAVEMFEAVADGRIKAIWIMATNPVVSLPDADAVRAALAACPFVVVSDVVRETDTTALAHVLLPAAAWGEKDGTVTNSERRISRQRGFLPLPGEARPDWWQIAEVARRMGFADAFGWDGAGAIFREHAALSAADNQGSRDFDIGGLAGLDDAGYDDLAPVQWPVPVTSQPGDTAPKRFFADGRFFTPDGKARFVPTPHRPLDLGAGNGFDMVLNTGRIRDQWHTMTRTGKTARLTAHIAEPFAEIHPADAARLGIDAAGLVRIASRHGSAVVRALVTDRQRPGAVFVPMHWTGQTASAARIDAVVAPATDPVSGQPGLKATAVRVAPFAASWYGFAVAATRPGTIAADYWALARARGGFRVELAGAAPVDAEQLLAGLVAPEPGDEVLRYQDAAAGIHRFAVFRAGRLIGALFLGPRPVAVSRSYVIGELARGDATAICDVSRSGEDADRASSRESGAGARLRLLAGRGGAAEPDTGAVVCSCFDVGVNTIVAAVTSGAAISVAAVGAALKAGTNCGSCRSEIGRIIDAHRVQKAG